MCYTHLAREISIIRHIVNNAINIEFLILTRPVSILYTDRTIEQGDKKMKQILSFTLALLLIIAVVPFSAIAVGGTAQSGIATPDEAMIAYLYGTENNIAYGKNYEIGVTGAGYEQYAEA